MNPIDTSKGQQLYQRARRRIPGGTQLLSKRPEMFLPGGWPSYYAKAKGAEVWDLDGNHFIDMSYSAIGSCILGYADPDVDAAVQQAVTDGSMCTLNCAEEVELAELLCELHPWADMVRYSRSGGEAMAIAARIARARARRSTILFCGYHGWHDWYLAANLSAGDALTGHLLPGLDPAGVPQALAGSAIPFRFNDADGFRAALQTAGDDLAAVIMEPLRSDYPAPGFLELIREETRRRQALLVFDEVTAGWRLCSGGAHLSLPIHPDIAVFAKAISNGFPMAAIIGTADAMQAAQDTFISSTYWTERIGPTAALATIRKHRALNLPAHLAAIGRAVQSAWSTAAAESNFPITVSGIAPLSRFSIDLPNPQAIRTLFTQMMLDRGFLATNSFYASYAHSQDHVTAYAKVLQEVFPQLKSATETNTVESQLRGPIAHSGFARLT